MIEALKLALEKVADALPAYIDGVASREYLSIIHKALAQPEQEYDWKDLYEKEKRRSAMWLAKYEEVAGPAPKAYPLAQPEQEPVAIVIEVNKVGAVALRMSADVTVGTRLYTTPPTQQSCSQRQPNQQELDASYASGYSIGFGEGHNAGKTQRQPLTHEQRFDLLTRFEPHKNKWEAPAILIDMVEAAHGIKE
jgi:hypothetical protein